MFAKKKKHFQRSEYRQDTSVDIIRGILIERIKHANYRLLGLWIWSIIREHIQWKLVGGGFNATFIYFLKKMALYWLTCKERSSKKKWICQLFKFEAILNWNCYNSTNLALDSYRIHYSKMLTSFSRYPKKLDLYSCKLTWSNLPLKITNLSFPEHNSILPSDICFCLLFSFISVDIWQWFQLRNSSHSSKF